MKKEIKKMRSKPQPTTKQDTKAIIFDIGGVLCHGISKVHFNLAKDFNIDLVKFYKSLHKYEKDAATGVLSSAGFPKLVAKDPKIKDYRKFIRRWSILLEKYLLIDKKIEKIIKILKKDYTIGTLTNVVKITDRIRRKKNMYKHFKIKLISCEVGLKKPDPKVYKLLIKKLNLSPQEIIFIDDNKKLLLSAKKLGINTILFKNHSQLVKDLRKFGVEI